MNILITGANGHLGTELKKLLPTAIAPTKKDLDITKEKAVRDFVKEYDIDTIINCAEYGDVDAAEENVHHARDVNAYGTKFLAQTGKNLIHISTNYVFDGKARTPYKTTDKPSPLSVYGNTKMMGELAVLKYAPVSVIIRTSWLFSQYGKNFMKTIQKLGTEESEINVVDNQIATPTYSADLASAIVQIIPQMNLFNSGIYHFTNLGQCSRYDFAYEIMKKSGLSCNVNPVSMLQSPTPAKRPMYSVLDKRKIQDVFGVQISDWQDALTRCINSRTK